MFLCSYDQVKVEDLIESPMYTTSMQVIGVSNYAAREHRTQLMAKTGLNSTIIEQTLESLGSLSYYSKNYGVVVEAKPYSVEALKANLGTVAAMLNISLDTSVINEDSMKALWLNAEVRALKQYNEAMDGDAVPTVEA